MNEFERRFVDQAINHRDLSAAVDAAGFSAIKRYFGYSATLGVDAVAMVVGQIYNASIPVQANGYFYMQHISLAASRSAAPQTAYPPSVNLQITDTGSGDVLFAGPTLGTLAAGSVGLLSTGIPLIMPTPRLIPPNSNILVEITPLASNAVPQLVYITLGGSRVEKV